MKVDLALRIRVTELQEYLAGLQLPGLVETSPGVRSVLIEYDPHALPLATLMQVGVLLIMMSV